MQIEPQVIAVQGTVLTKGGQAVLFPQPGQDITEPTLLIMKDLPVGGNAQQRFNAAVAYFKPKTGVISVKGTLTPFDGDQIFIVVTD